MAQYRKTRIVCISDTHGYSPAEAGFSLPPGDVLIHAGDLSNRGTKPELERTFKWIEDADYEVKIVVAGNHDVTLDSGFYAEHGSHFHQDEEAMKEHASSIDIVNQLKEKPTSSIIFLNHESTLIKLTRPDGPRTMFKVFGSPFSRFSGLWAFGYSSSAEDGDRLWRQIPTDIDILVTHTPPFGLCDRRANDNGKINPEGKQHGCEQLLRAMASVRPMLAVCGHVHEGRGYRRVMWTEDGSGFTLPKVEDTEPLPPSNSKKQNLIDLTGKKQRGLQNTSSCATPIFETETQLTSRTLNSDGDDSSNPRRHPRKETCVVNAAIMAKSWPYAGGKLFNRPIVVDINLPVWEYP